MVAIDADYFRDLETPRLAHLSSNLVAAAFPLMKLMPARHILDRAASNGELKPGAHIVETTSGTFGMAVALLAAARGYRLTLVTASTLIDAKYKARLERIGASVIALDDPRGDGNQPGRLECLHDILAREPDGFWTRQYDSPGNWLAYARLAELLIRAMGRIDCLVGCIGTGGSLCGTAWFLRTIFPHLTVFAVDTHHSILFGQPVGKRMLRGLGNSVLPKNVRHELVDEIHWVGAYPAYMAAHRLLRDHGIFMGPTSGAAALVAQWVATKHPDAQVAAIMPDEGHRHIETVYNDDWLSSLPGWPCAQVSEPNTLSIIAPRAETQWTRFVWNRRSLAEVLETQAAVKAQTSD
ncbi:PLP-dependent cysteine synthase family protein [Mesorhizobium sp. WSM4307]|uniref:PLP-dependent cysteine synthase family protein n=1 Tax=unclassified Mesorhizobium TaxID=325217 RepID=UPI00115D078D|nr:MULTISPECIES: PLP-dependent cysteine synthase family protein [unclassified Mesorhizobium]TRC75240.1 PLP-dependent cysteine synthase family protein [Mesorhizobium sp. WSM4310]TRC77951.1 PLP-dependent cysteine synthase family protein [Mesorhizobium sp. WSM4315]TRC78653.1 PLP-dependent cysteine synthase family protein [Mesorhizobium sp. WSM4307]